jgi:uncharacterized membrane protein YphA (DoxX/SURF4 family)
VLEWVPRLLVAVLFAYTGITKILDPETFIKEVRAYEMVPMLWSNAVAYVLPWLEVIVAALLVLDLWRRDARLVIAGMLIVFTAAKGYLLAQGHVFDCGCVPTSSFLHVLFDGWIGVGTNVVLLLLLVLEASLEWLRRRRRPAAVSADPEPVPA